MNSESSSATIARELGMGCIDEINLSLCPIDLIKKIPYNFVKEHILLPIADEGSSVTVAISDPLNIQAISDLRLLFDREIHTLFSPRETLCAAIEEIYRNEVRSASDFLKGMGGSNIKGEQESAQFTVDSYDLLDNSNEPPIIQLLNLVLTEAIDQGASDIHFEPVEGGLRIRYRIDGVLHTRHNMDNKHHKQLVTRIKVLAQLDIAEQRLPQDGRIKLKMTEKDIDFRISTIPSVYGERVVMRILDKGSLSLGLEKIGMPSDVFNTFRKLVGSSDGILFVTGPTGSGKTTTLYSALAEMNTEERNVMTVEDPVEYKLPGIAQIGVNPKIGFNFARGLRHILRQDPDVIMIGEIRDKETAEIAIQASLTGHLVLSTLHTNDAPSAVTRLIDMGVEPYLVSSTVIGVIAQRLVRRICPHCRTSYHPSLQEKEELSLHDDGIPDLFFKGEGCDNCYETGYLGRSGIFEMMPMTHPIKQALLRSADASNLRRLAKEEGLISLRERAAHLVADGVTSVAELMRISLRYEGG
ncbi:type II/IV secretion system protein [Simkania negevensis]|uniref:Type II/IV secretion system protein n=1 Tax=Simkania negevensis TaxID=83561 RepID=A0ABS3AS28_9BACT|nr:type II/IV secretion system protein [Simkania negevensis]